jgi:hypothetical protein
MESVLVVAVLTIIRLGVPFALMMLIGTIVHNRQVNRAM